MISPQFPKTLSGELQGSQRSRNIKYAQSPKNQINMSSNISYFSRIASSPKSQPGNVLQERFNTFQHDTFFPVKNHTKNKGIPTIKATKKKELKQSYNENLLEISSLYEIYDDKKSDSDYYNELDNLIDSLKEAKTLLEEKEKSLSTIQEQFNQSNIEKEKLQEEVDELKYLFELVQDPSEEAKKEIQDYKEKIDMMKHEIQIERNQNSLLKNQISSYGDQIKELQEKEKKIQDILDSSQKENKSLLNSLKEKEEIIKTFQNDDKLNLILHNDSLLEKVNVYEKADKEKAEQIANLQESVSEAQQQIKKYIEEKEKAEAEIQNLLLNNSVIKSKNVEMKNDIRSKEQLISGLESNNIKFQKTIIEQENSIKELNKTIEITRNMLEKMGEDRKIQVVITEKGKIAELEDLLQEKKHCLKSMMEKYDQMKIDFDKKDQELTKAQKDLMDQTSITVSFASRLTQKESELNDLQQNQSILNRQIEDTKKKNQSLERLLKNKIEQVNIILREKGKEIIQLQQTINSLTSEKEKDKKELYNYSEDIQKLKDDIEIFKSSNQNLENQNKELEQNLLTVKENLRKFESQNGLLESKLNNSSKVVDEMSAKINLYENSIKEYCKVENDLKQSMKKILDEKEILAQKFIENEVALNSLTRNFEEVKLKYDDLLEKCQNDEQISQKYEEVKSKYDNLLNSFSEQEDQILKLSEEKETFKAEVTQLNEENKILLYKIDSLQNEFNDNYDNYSQSYNNGLKSSLPSNSKCSDTISSMQQKIKLQNRKLNEMHKIITELNQLIQVLEGQIKKFNSSSSSNYEKEQLIEENILLHEKIESLKIEKDQMKKELINVKTMARQLTQVLETFKK